MGSSAAEGGLRAAALVLSRDVLCGRTLLMTGNPCCEPEVLSVAGLRVGIAMAGSSSSLNRIKVSGMSSFKG